MVAVAIGHDGLIERNRPADTNFWVSEVGKAIFVVEVSAPMSTDAVEIIGVVFEYLERVADALWDENGRAGSNFDCCGATETVALAKVDPGSKYFAFDDGQVLVPWFSVEATDNAGGFVVAGAGLDDIETGWHASSDELLSLVGFLVVATIIFNFGDIEN